MPRELPPRGPLRLSGTLPSKACATPAEFTAAGVMNPYLAESWRSGLAKTQLIAGSVGSMSWEKTRETVRARIEKRGVIEGSPSALPPVLPRAQVQASGVLDRVLGKAPALGRVLRRAESPPVGSDARGRAHALCFRGPCFKPGLSPAGQLKCDADEILNSKKNTCSKPN